MVNQILKVGARWYNKDKLSDAEKKLIHDEYYKETRQRMGDCGACFATMYQYFLNLKPKSMKPQLFKIAPGKRVMLHGSGDVLTEKNCTDSAALAMLKTNPKALSHFAIYPDNWKELADNFDILKAAKADKDEAEAEAKKDFYVGAGETEPETKTEQSVAHIQKFFREELKALEPDQLKDLCIANEYPESEWENLNKKKLIGYLLGKNN